ncbi:hypothetical protein [Planctomycetes bacterium TBK1r]|uniref:Uncharacterized protein n=1 Tax=Stieleria magnilauensis TaxID=2527963 RepID=A0ABX5Y1G3_9BACT|nr:hypothetical protein TBK1r_66510 [Planctomycetes bacterium TBK1r]
MPFVIGRTDGSLDFDSLVAQLFCAFPESRMISDDYYRDRIEREKEIAKRLGMAEDSAPIRCTERVALEHGTQRHLAVSISQGITLDARIDRLGILAVGGDDTVVCRAAVQGLIEFLRAWNLEIETSWDDVK